MQLYVGQFNSDVRIHVACRLGSLRSSLCCMELNSSFKPMLQSFVCWNNVLDFRPNYRPKTCRKVIMLQEFNEPARTQKQIKDGKGTAR